MKLQGVISFLSIPRAWVKCIKGKTFNGENGRVDCKWWDCIIN